MRRIGIWTLLIMVGAALGTATNSSDVEAQTVGGPKLGFIDVEDVKMGFNAFKDKENEIDKAQDEAQREVDQMVKKLKEESAGLEAKKDLLQPAAYNGQRADLRKKMSDLGYTTAKRERDLRKLRQEALAPLYEQLDQAIQAVAKEQGFAFVFLRKRIAYGAAQYDITQQVIDQLNR